MSKAGPYSVTTHDPTYRAIVGYLDKCGYYFRVVEGRPDEDDQDVEVDSAGLDGEYPHLAQFLDASGSYFDWSAHVDLLRELKRCDPALNLCNPNMARLLAEAMAV